MNSSVVKCKVYTAGLNLANKLIRWAPSRISHGSSLASRTTRRAHVSLKLHFPDIVMGNWYQAGGASTPYVWR